MLYFKGCTARERLNNISESTEKILKILGIDFETLGDDEECCGSVLLRTGFQDDAKEHMEKNVNKLKDKQILVSCAGCYKTLKEDYNKHLGIELDVIHISQFLRDLIDEKSIDSTNMDNDIHLNIDKNTDNLDLTVTYHDPCHLGRHSGEYDAPRDVIETFANLVEMENIRENSKCCGSGGGVKSAFPDIASSIASERSKEAENTGCDLLVTSCPFCKLNLDENSSLEVLDLSEFALKYIQNLNNDKDNNVDDCFDKDNNLKKSEEDL